MNFELFFKDKRILNILSDEDLDFVIGKTKEIALYHYRTYNDDENQNLSKDDFIALQKTLKK